MKKIDLVIIPFHDYKKWIKEGFRTRDAHLYEHFKKNDYINNILVINRPVSIPEMILKKESWKSEPKNTPVYKGKKWRIVKSDENAYYLDIFSNDILRVIFERKKWWYSIFESNEIISIIKEACQKLKLENIWILLQNPMAIGVITKLEENKLIFDAIDNWLYHPQIKRYKELLQRNYNYIDEKADNIFTVSMDLQNLFPKNNKKKWISNGVDVEYFSKCISNYSNKRNITIGYMGKIQDRIDFELIEKCLNKFNKIDFVFLGQILSCKNKVKYLESKYKNIRFMGDIHYKDLPNELGKIDIAIVPHLINEFTNSMNPLKLYEYLAAGKQVVTTAIAGSENLSKYIYISKDSNEFLANISIAIRRYLNDRSLGNKIAGTLSKEYSWQSKSDEIIQRALESDINNDIK